jgi:Holliday junction resolvasome RuvABC endonuclease subunit
VSVAPTEVKKFATGKGNAKKDDMLEAFIIQTGVDPRVVLDYYGETPISDIVDSYFICNYKGEQ